MDPSHRKIELQSPADLTFLTTQLRTAARAKLDLHLPPVSSSSSSTNPTTTAITPPEPDDLRRHTEDLVDAFVAQIVHGLRSNISINGLDVVGESGNGNGNWNGSSAVEGDGGVEVEDFEAFDEKLRVRVGEAVRRRDLLVGRISGHRRGTAGEAARRFEEGMRGVVEGERGVEGEMRERAGGVGGGEGALLGVRAGARAEEVERNWERALEGLARLKTGLPETRARLERAGGVVGYLEGGRGT